MLLTTLMIVASLASPPETPAEPLAGTYRGPTPVGALARFTDNDRRVRYEDGRRARHVAWRQVVIQERQGLAERLDRLIAAQRCGDARLVADRAGYADIRDRVHEICEAGASDSADAAAPS